MRSLRRHIAIASIFVVFVSYQIAICGDVLSAKEDLEGFSSLTDYKKQEQIKLIICSQTSDNQRRNFKSSEDLKAEVSRKLDLGNPYIADTAMNIASEYPGEYNINQVCAIYDAMTSGGWYYYSEANDVDFFQNANLTLQRGKISNTIGRGDCDDFAILMASLIESLGGSTRTIFAFDQLNKNGHAYTEVYLGNVDDPHVAELVSWLKDEYPGEDFTGFNVTGDSKWLNLDWGAGHPGGPYFGNDSSHIWQAIIRESPIKTSPKVVPMIDPMESTAGWEIIKDDNGSSINISTIPMKKGFAMEITYNLTEGGWVGISKYIDPMAFIETNGINLSYFSIGAENAMEMRVACEDGTAFGVSWIQPKRETWSYHKALYSDFRCLSEGCQGYDNKLNKNKIREVELIIFNNPEYGDVPGSGKVIIDQIQGIMAIEIGSPWARAEEKRQREMAVSLAAQAELLIDQDASLLQRSLLLSIESMRRYPSLEADQAIRRGLELMARPLAKMNHETWVFDAKFSPDGQLIATAAWDWTARIWDAKTGREILKLAHAGTVDSGLFSPNGKILATLCSDKNVRLWDVGIGLNLANLTHGDFVNALSFNPNGSSLATACEDKKVRVWENGTWKVVKTLLSDDRVMDIEFSPDGSLLAEASYGDKSKVWNTKTWEEIANLSSDTAYSVDFSSDGKWIALRGSREARIWKVENWEEAANLKHIDYLNDMAFSPDGTMMATVSDDRTARLWEIPSGKEMRVIPHDNKVDSVKFSPDGRLIATICGATVRVWDLSGKEVARINDGGAINSIDFSPDGELLATSSYDSVAMLWKVRVGQEVATLEHGDMAFAVDFSPDGELLATACRDNTEITSYKRVRLFNASTGQEITGLPHKNGVFRIQFSPDGSKLATVDSDTLRLWDTKNIGEVSNICQENSISALDFNEEGDLIAIASIDNTASICDVKTGRKIHTLHHQDWVTDVAFSPEGNVVATASWDGTAIMWNVMNGTKRYEFHFDDKIESVAFSPSGRLLAVGSQNGTVTLWDWFAGRKIATLINEDSVGDILFSWNGEILSAKTQSYVNLWNLKTYKWIARLSHERYSMDSVDFSPYGDYLATAGSDRTARIWEANTGKEVARVAHRAPVRAVTFSPDGKYLATASEDGTVKLWLWRPEDLIKEACSRLNRNLTQEEWRQYLGDEPYRETCNCNENYSGQG